MKSGQLWRAKEILQGSVASFPYDPLLYEQYGLILLQMHDTLEAGKYLFLSGRTEMDCQEAVYVYLLRFGQKDWKTLVNSFPRCARNVPFDEFPASVREKLEQLQLPKGRGGETAAETLVAPDKRWNDGLALATCSCFAFLAMICIGGVAVGLFELISGWLR